MLYLPLCHQTVKAQINVVWPGVNPLHSGFQTPRFTKCALRGLKSPLGLICHICQLRLPCQSLIQNKPKVFDLDSCNVYPERSGSFRPLKSLLLGSSTTPIFYELTEPRSITPVVPHQGLKKLWDGVQEFSTCLDSNIICVSQCTAAILESS